MSVITPLHDDIASAISQVCLRVNWRDFTRMNYSSTDSLLATLNIAKNEPDILKCIERLCRRYGVLATKADISELERLSEQSEDAMWIVRNHTQYIGLLAMKKSREVWDAAKEKRESKNAVLN